MATRDNTNVRVNGDEMGQILNLKQKLEHHDQLWGYVNRYRALGWEVAIVRARGGGTVDLDLAQPEESWWQQLADLGLTGVQVNLAIRTGQPSRLLVLEVNKGQGTLSLDLLGDWRSPCVAELGNCREQHYYTLPPDQPPPSSHFLAQDVLIYAEGGLILAPPSIESEGREPWRWLTPPWEMAPQPKPAVWKFIQEQTASAAAEVPSWEEIYQVVVPHSSVLKALLGPPLTMEQYYREILQAALAAGLNDRQLLLGLLWHAPNGDARTNRERWKQLQGLLAVAQPAPGGYQAAPGLKPDGGASPAGVWLGWNPAPEPPVPVVPSPMPPALAPGVEELTRQLLGDGDAEPAKFDQSVSGQFFQLLSGLGEKVITESCRNEAILSGLETKATELERLVSEIEQFAGPAESKSSPRPLGAQNPMELLAAFTPSPRKNKILQEVKAMVQDFFNNNPDLAEDQSKIQMVLFCLKNYISINPDYASLPFRDKLEKSGQMARSFLGQPAKP